MFTAKDALYQSMAYTDKKTGDIPKTSTLEDLTDVNITEPSNGEVLKYDADNNEWKNSSIPTPTPTVEPYKLMVSTDGFPYTIITGRLYGYWDDAQHIPDTVYAEAKAIYDAGGKVLMSAYDLYVPADYDFPPNGDVDYVEYMTFDDITGRYGSLSFTNIGTMTGFIFEWFTSIDAEHSELYRFMLVDPESDGYRYPFVAERSFVSYAPTYNTPFVLNNDVTWALIVDAIAHGVTLFQYNNTLYTTISKVDSSTIELIGFAIETDSTDYLDVNLLIVNKSGDSWTVAEARQIHYAPVNS